MDSQDLKKFILEHFVTKSGKINSNFAKENGGLITNWTILS